MSSEPQESQSAPDAEASGIEASEVGSRESGVGNREAPPTAESQSQISTADAPVPGPVAVAQPDQAQAQSSGEDQANRPRIKIGSQRGGSPPPKAPPRVKTVFKTPDPSAPRQDQRGARPPRDRNRPGDRRQGPGGPPQSGPQQGEAPASQPSAEAPPPTQPPQQESPVAAVLAPGESFVPKPVPLEVGKGVKKLPSFVSSSGAKVALPNLRQELPPELAQELNEALGDMSVDDLLAAETKAAGVPAVGVEIEPESKQRGAVLRVSRDDVFVELPGQNQGVVPLHQFGEPPQAGAMLEVIVTRFNAEDGLYELTLPQAAVDVGDWSEIAEGMIVEAHVTGHNKGGLECEVNRLRGFIPASQVSNYRVENLEQFVGQKFACVVTEANAERRNLVLSRRAVLEREQAAAKEKLLAELAPGQIREGIVRSLRDFGAFVDLGGVDGLLHVSQMSWDRIKHPSDVLQVGQKVRVKVEKIDPQTHKISLNLRDFVENPWANVTSKYPVTSRVKGTVSKIMDFGAFVRLEGGVEGLVHVSEIAHQRVFRVSDFLSEGQEVEAKVMSVDPEAQRISLSIKAVMARPEPVKKEVEPEPESEPPPPPSKRKTPLKGGLGRAGEGAQFGLKW